MSQHDYSENTLLHQPSIVLLNKLGYQCADCKNEVFGRNATHGRLTTTEVVLVPRLRAALTKLNPNLPKASAREILDQSIEEMTRSRAALSLVQANREIYELLKNGIKVSYQKDGETVVTTLKVIDWDEPNNNDFFVASEFWISSEIHRRRPDLIGFVNGLPLVVIELKKTHTMLESAYNGNFRDYRNTIPQLFWYNALVILSNGTQTKVGSITSGFEHFFDWKRINDEEEKGVISLETVIRGVCDKTRLLDIVENFTLFDDARGELIKLIGKNHQYLGVNNAIKALKHVKSKEGKLGVFWHTQGSGKSYSMVFFSKKVLRKVPGNWTFLVLTDREDLDNQIYKNFANTGAVLEKADTCRAKSGRHLQQLLRENHRYLFTLIQKFGIERPANAPKEWKQDKEYPVLSTRSDIIVMADEAHRSQYDILSTNMRNALPQAAFIAFTGTPLLAGEKKTRTTFGEYVSIYNFRQSIEDGATVPLYYENRIPEMQLENANLKDDLDELINSAELNDDQLKKLEREFAREYHLITREDRLDKVADDLVSHFVDRSDTGKAMVVCIDKLTAVKMYEKVKKYWKAYLGDLNGKLAVASAEMKPAIQARIDFLKQTDMAVVVSDQQNEEEFFQKHNIDIKFHRTRMVKEDLENRFKDPADRFRLVFVCAMWITGFDAPCVSTIYLDKPMKNHTLMQTMARANRVFGNKNNGLIVDYVGVFRDLKKALAIYGGGLGAGAGSGDMPVKIKDQLVEDLRAAIKEATGFCKERGVDIQKIIDAEGFEKVAALDHASSVIVDKKIGDSLDDAVEKVIVNDQFKRKFLLLAAQVLRLFKAILPDKVSNEFLATKACFAVLAEKIREFTKGEKTSIENVLKSVEELLDRSIATKGYVIHATEKTILLDLSNIDFDKLAEWFKKSRKRTAIEKIRKSVDEKLQKMLEQNKTRTDLVDKFNKLIKDYNAGVDVETIFERLKSFIAELNEEEKRETREELNAEQLAIFDLLTRPDPELTKSEKDQVKKVARELLQKLKETKLVLDWRKRQQSKAQVRQAINEYLDTLPPAYTREIYARKCDAVFDHIYEKYEGEDKSVYQ